MKKRIALPSNSYPCYLFSISNFNVFKMGLKLYGDFTWKSKVKKMFLYISMPLLRYLKSNLRKEIQEKVFLIDEIIKKEIKNNSYDINLYFPSEKKAVVQIINHNKVFGFMKISFDKKGSELLKSEIKILNLLKKMNFNSFEVPEVIKYGEYNNKLFFIFLTSPEKYSLLRNYELNEEIVKISAELFLSKTDMKELGESYLYKKIEKNLQKVKFLNEKEREKLLKEMEENKNILIPLGIVHYDFKPWNFVRNLKTSKLFLFDWEDARLEGLPLWDIFAYIIFTYVSLFNKVSPETLLGKLKKFYFFINIYLGMVRLNISDEIILFILKLYLMELLLDDSLWNRRERDEKSRISKLSLLRFLKTLIDK